MIISAFVAATIIRTLSGLRSYERWDLTVHWRTFIIALDGVWGAVGTTDHLDEPTSLDDCVSWHKCSINNDTNDSTIKR